LKSCKVLRCTHNTIQSPEELIKSLAEIQKQGYAIDDEEFYEGVRCIASPIREYSGKVIAAVSIAGPSVRMSNAKLTQLRRPISKATDKISRNLGYRSKEG
jgi:DNA-binding IclR family transcriptional regulator